MSALTDRIAALRERIARAVAASSRTPDQVLLVAVSKTVPAETVVAAAQAGLSSFGENRMQEAVGKMAAAAEILGEKRISWHLVGHLQSNKARAAAGRFELIHAVDDVELARKLDRAAGELGVRQRVLIQVNVGGESSKSGIEPDGLTALAEAVAELPALELRGLMTVPPYDPDPERSRRYFAALRELGEKLGARLGASAYAAELSMGMSEDFAMAIEEGATLIRVGRAIFGERSTAASPAS